MMAKFAITLLLVMGMAYSAPFPATSCSNNPNTGFTCDVFPTDSVGNPNRTGANTFTLPNTVFAGYLVVEFVSAIANSDRTNWAGVLKLTTTSGQFFENGCGSGLLGDISCFPTYSTVTSSPNAFIQLNALNPTGYDAPPNTYNISFDSFEGGGTGIPEPLPSVLIGAGLVATAFLRRRK